MHVGFSPVFMNTANALSDLECFKHELALADLAEPFGFDSIWQPEHHFSGYEMTPNVLNFLTYMAGRTKDILLGSGAVAQFFGRNRDNREAPRGIPGAGWPGRLPTRAGPPLVTVPRRFRRRSPGCRD